MLFKIFRVVLLVVLLVFLCLLILIKATPQGQEIWKEISERSQDAIHGGDAREAGQKLTQMKVHMGTLPPDSNYVTLDCSHVKLGDEGFRLIGKCIQLETVTLIDSDINDDRAKNLANLTRLTSLSLVRTGEVKDAGAVTDAGISYLGSMTDLAGLILKGMNVGDATLKQIGKLPDLRTLELSGTKVTDAGMPSLTSLKKLQWLVIGDTAITDDGVAKLSGLTDLKQVTLKGSKVTSKGMEALKKMYPDLTID